MKGWLLFVKVVLLSMVFPSHAARITTLNGDVEGLSDVILGVTVESYLGIPYATPPIGKLRFRSPVPVENWPGVFNATTQPNSCMQLPDTYFGRFPGVEMWNNNTPVSEDCLYLNIFTPKTAKKSMPTLIWIYGGSFVYGSATLDVYDGRYLAATQSVILVAIQYRMSVQGFLYTGTDDAPGNVGLLDQQLAFKWIHDNIDQFGGDRTKITLFGESSGAASVSHHLLAPTSWPFFTNAIMLSASSVSPWAVDPPTDLLAHTHALARVTNCNNSDTSEMIKCLRDLDAFDLENKQWELNNKYIGTFSPTVDGYFLQSDPQTLINSGKMKKTDIMLGSTKDEGEFFLIYFFQDVILPSNLWNPVGLNRSEYEDLVCRITHCATDIERDTIKYVYEQSTIPDNRGSYMDLLDDILGDIYFKCPVRELADAYKKHTEGHVYVYSFEYRQSGNPWPSWMGALHGYEIELMFGQPYNDNYQFPTDDLDYNVSTKAMKYISEFANNGNLDTFAPEWPDYTSDQEQHIVFQTDGGVSVRHGYRTKECSFWKYLMPKIKEKLAPAHNFQPLTKA